MKTRNTRTYHQILSATMAVALAVLVCSTSAARAKDEVKDTGTSVKGNVHGVEMNYTHATFEDLVADGKYFAHYLVLRTSADAFSSLDLRTTFRLEKGVLPEGKTFTRTATDKKFDTPLARLDLEWPTADGNDTESESLHEGFDIEIVFGAAEDNRLPGTFRLSTPDKKIELSGSFTAEMDCLRLKDGVPDLSSDGNEVWHHAVKLFLEKKLGKKIEIKETSENGRMTSSIEEGSKKTAITCVHYAVEGDTNPQYARFVLAKARQWSVTQELRKDQLHMAHLDDKMFGAFPWKKVEEDIQKRHPGKLIFASIIMNKMKPFDGSANFEKMAVTIEYQVEGVKNEAPDSEVEPDPNDLEIQKDLKPHEFLWLLQKKQGEKGYEFVRELTPEEYPK